jgi:hypothetical protein
MKRSSFARYVGGIGLRIAPSRVAASASTRNSVQFGS